MDVENVKKNNTKPIVLIIIGLLIVLLIVLGVIYKIRVVGNPVNLTTTALRSLSNNFDRNSNMGKLMSFTEEADTLETKMAGNVTLPMNYGIVSFDMLIQEDSDEEEAIMDLNILKDNVNQLHLEGQLDKSALYFALKENPIKYYYLKDIKYPEELEEIDYEDLLEKFVMSFEEIVTKEDFIETEKEITVNGEVIKSKQYSLNLNQLLITKLTNKVIEKILIDEDLIEDLSSFTKMTEIELRDLLESYKTDLTTLESPDDVSFIYNVYVYRNTAVRFEFVDALDIESSIKFDNYKYLEILINLMDTNISLKHDDNIWTINGKSEDFKLIGTIEEEKYNINITTADVNMTLNGNQSFNYDKAGITFSENGKLTISQEGASIEVPYDFNISFKEITRVNKKNTANKVDINNMTVEEENEFNMELSQIPLFSLFGFSNDMSSNYNKEVYYNSGIDSNDYNNNNENVYMY